MDTPASAVHEIFWLGLSATRDNVGDIYERAIDLYGQIPSPHERQVAEYYITKIRSMAREADIGWRLFACPPMPAHSLTEEEQIQIITIVATLRSFCYGVERLDEASFVTGPDSTPVRFYINSLYHYIAALYLLDRNNDPIGGTVYKTLHPMGLASLLDPIAEVLAKPMNGMSFGETVRKIRNDFLVHGRFSPDDIATVVARTRMRDLSQVIRLADLIWELFNQSFILKLKLIALLTQAGTDPGALAAKYVSSQQT